MPILARAINALNDVVAQAMSISLSLLASATRTGCQLKADSFYVLDSLGDAAYTGCIT